MDIRSSILSFGTQVDTTAMTKSITTIKNQMENNVRDAFSTGMKQGLSLKHMDAVRKKMTDTSKEISDIQERIRRETYKMNSTSASDAMKSAAAVNKEMLEGQLQNQAQALGADTDRIANLSNKLEQMQTDDSKHWMAMTGKSVETFGEGMHSVFSDITSKDVTSIFGVIQKGAAKLQQIQAKAVASKEAGGSGGMAKIAGVLSKLGPTLVAIGAIAAGFAAVVKLIIDVDAQAKDLHRTLMESGVSVGDIDGGARDLEKSLRDVREMAVDVSNNMDWGTQAEDQIKIIGAWNEAGYTMKEMVGTLDKGEKSMNAYQKATSAALTYSKLLGESSDKVAQDMTGMMEQLGMSLAGVKENFAMIYDAAQMSGFGTKRFFGMVLQATTGMGMYNVRLEQTAAMLLNLNKILGTKFGAEFFQKLTGQFSGDSAQEGMKKIMLRGGDAVSAALKSQAEYTADGVMNVFKSNFKGDFATGLKSIFGDEGSELAAQLSDADTRGEGISALVATLGGMSSKDQSALFVRTQKEVGDDAARQLQQLFVQVNGISGSMGEQMNALRAMGPGGVLVDNMSRMLDVTGAKSMAELSSKLGAISQVTLESLHGIDSTMRDQMTALAVSTGGQWNDMKKLQERMGTSEFEGKEGQAKLLAEQTEQIKHWGATAIDTNTISHAKLDENNKVLETGFKKLENEKDLLMGRVKADANMAKTMSEQEALAKMTAAATTDMSAYLEMGVKYFLNGIYSTTQSILGAITGKDLEPDEVIARDKALDTQQKVSAGLRDQLGKKTNQINAAKLKMEQVGGPERKVLKEQLKVLVSQKINAEKQLKVSQAQESAILKITGGGWLAFDKTTSDFGSEARESVAKDQFGRTEGMAKEQFGGQGFYNKVSRPITFNNSKVRQKLQETNPEELKALLKLEEEGLDITKDLATLANAGYQKQIAFQKTLSHQEGLDADTRQKNKIAADEGSTSKINAKDNAKAMQDEVLRNLIQDKLGVSVSDRMLREVRGGTSEDLKGKARDDLMHKFRNPHGSVETPNDFILTTGGRLIKPNSKDTIVGSKPGGPLDRSRGKATSIINNYYLPNDANQNLMTITKAQKAGMI